MIKLLILSFLLIGCYNPNIHYETFQIYKSSNNQSKEAIVKSLGKQLGCTCKCVKETDAYYEIKCEINY